MDSWLLVEVYGGLHILRVPTTTKTTLHYFARQRWVDMSQPYATVCMYVCVCAAQLHCTLDIYKHIMLDTLSDVRPFFVRAIRPRIACKSKSYMPTCGWNTKRTLFVRWFGVRGERCECVCVCMFVCAASDIHSHQQNDTDTTACSTLAMPSHHKHHTIICVYMCVCMSYTHI